MATSGERTEQPTPRRLETARRRGEVAVSRDLVSAAAVTAAIGALVVEGPALAARMIEIFRGAFAPSRLGLVPSDGAVTAALAAGAVVGAQALVWPLGAAMAAALGAGLLQTRGLVALGAVAPDLGRVSPGAGLRRLLGGRAAWEVGKGLAKATLVGVIVWVTARPVLAGLAGLAGASPARALSALGALAERLAVRVAFVALALGVADYLLARRRHLLGLRMTRDEVKRDHKEAEGDPDHRAERLRLHREVLEQRMIADVRRADFVVVNPEHIAVALRYDASGDAAPVVVARGERLLAERIKAAAREAGVPIFRDVTLARSLRELPEGAEIPEALYEAVAEVLRVVYGARAAPAGPRQAADGRAPRADVVARAVPAGWKRA